MEWEEGRGRDGVEKGVRKVTGTTMPFGPSGWLLSLGE